MNVKEAALVATVAMSLLAGIVIGGGVFRRPERSDDALKAAAPEVPRVKPEKSVYVGRWHANRTETVPGVATVLVDETLTVRADGTAVRESTSEMRGYEPTTATMNFRWEQKEGQLVAFTTDEKFVNENGDEPEIVGIVRDDGRFVAKYLWWMEPTVVFERVPVTP